MGLAPLGLEISSSQFHLSPFLSISKISRRVQSSDRSNARCVAVLRERRLREK